MSAFVEWCNTHYEIVPYCIGVTFLSFVSQVIAYCVKGGSSHERND